MKVFERLRPKLLAPECWGRGRVACVSFGAGLLAGVAIASYDLETAEYLVLWLVVIVTVGLVLNRVIQNGKGWDSHDY